MPPVKGRPRKLPHYANRGKTSSSGGELASARSCFSTVRTALGKLRITGLLAQFDIARSFPQFPRPLLLQPTILTSERGTRFGIRKAPNHVPPPHLPDDPFFLPVLEVNVSVLGGAFMISMRYNKTLFDSVSGKNSFATTWNRSILGTQGGTDYIVSRLSELLDEFLTEYLRVNEAACTGSPQPPTQ